MSKLAVESAVPLDVTHPARVLREVFMGPLGLNANSLARALHLSPQRVWDVLNNRRAVSADTALRLSKLFGTSPQFWLLLQVEYDLQDAQKNWSKDLDDKIKRIDVPNRGDLMPAGTKDDGKDRVAPPVNLEDTEKKVFEVLTAEKVHFDVLSQKLALNAGQLSAALTTLEFSELIERSPGDWYAKAKRYR